MGWWTVHAERTFTDTVPAAPEQVRAFYVDLHNMKLVHPLVVSVRPTSRRQTGDGYIESYRVRDRVRLGPLVIRISYRARLHVPAQGDVITDARQFPGVRLRGAVTFEPSQSGTRIIERIHITAPRPLATVTTRQAANAHIAMLAGIRQRFQLPSVQ
ncbi:SRPBCC family protein [uncultured Mycobacterium sp.]|uniref:SRPBCC family protein n=1 Tax=uncultured Mycobacterium sp. TaxID=171292 RepID=UPI0035CAA2D2